LAFKVVDVATTLSDPQVAFEFSPDEAAKYPASGSDAETSRRFIPPVPTVANMVPDPLAKFESLSAMHPLTAEVPGTIDAHPADLAS
jgi:hypothetical protein